MAQRDPDPRSVLGPVTRFLLLFGAAFLAPGLLLVQHYARIAATWPEADAEGRGGNVVSYREKKKTYYRVNYELAYRAGGRDYRTPVSESGSTSDQKAAGRKAERFAPGTRHRIRYNPENPHEIRTDVGTVVFWLLPGLFTGVGLLMVLLGLWALKRWKRSYSGPACPSCRAPILERYTHCPQCGTRTAPRNQPPSDGTEEEMELAAAIRSRKGERVGGGVFLVLGLGMLAGALLLGAKPYAARQWPAAEAEVVESEFLREPGSRGREQYRVRLRLRLAGDATAEEGIGPSGNYGWVRRLADEHATGSRVEVRRNTADPGDVFLVANWGIDMLVLPAALGFLGLVFSGIGVGVLWKTLRFREIRCPACRLPAAARHRWCARCGMTLGGSGAA